MLFRCISQAIFLCFLINVCSFAIVGAPVPLEGAPRKENQADEQGKEAPAQMDESVDKAPGTKGVVPPHEMGMPEGVKAGDSHDDVPVAPFEDPLSLSTELEQDLRLYRKRSFGQEKAELPGRLDSEEAYRPFDLKTEQALRDILLQHYSHPLQAFTLNDNVRKQLSMAFPTLFEEQPEALAFYIEYFLQNMPIAELRIEDAFFSMLNKDVVEHIASIVYGHSELKILSFARQPIAQDAMEILASMIRNNHSLHTLDLSGIKFDRSSWHLLMDGLKNNHALQSLNLSGTDLDDQFLSTLVSYAKGNSKLTSLNLAGNRISAVGMRKLLHLEPLKELDISHNPLKDEGALYYARFIAQRPVTRVMCQHMGISDEGAFDIAYVFKYVDHIVECDFSKNHLTDVGLKHLLPLLVRSEAVDLGENGIGDQGIYYLAKAMKRRGVIQHLSLRGNRITDQGFLFLLHTIPQGNSSRMLYGGPVHYLMWLDISHNKLTDQTAYNLAEALGGISNFHIEMLGHSFARKTQRMLRHFIYSRPDITIVY